MARNTVIVSVLADTKKFASGMKGANSALGKLGSVGKTAVKTVAGIGVALAGLAIAGGFARALKMDEAKTQLDALGYSGKQVAGIMDSALASVKGTAFGLDAAATIAANALASGKREGDELTRSLTLVANTAALAKVDMGDMGAVFQKVWANGKVTTKEMNQLADRGVPIWQYLGESFGVSNEELRKMIERGEVTADMFESALGPAVEGMATKMSGSFKGMLANAQAALSRLGQLFATPILDISKTGLAEFTTVVDALAAKMKPAADAFQEFVDKFQAGEAIFGATDLGGILQGVLNNAIGWIRTEGISGIAAAFLEMRSAVASAMFDIADSITQNFPAIIATIGDVFVQLGASTIEMAPYLLSAGIAVIQALADGVAGTLPTVIDKLVALLPSLVGTLASMAPQLLGAGINLIQQLVQAAVTVLPNLISTVVGLIPQIVAAVVGMVPTLLAGAVQLFQTLIQAVVQVIPPLLTQMVEILPGIVESLLSMIPMLLDSAILLFTSLVEALPLIIPPLIEAVIALLPVLLESIIGMIPGILDGAIQLFTALVESLPIILPLLLTSIINLLPSIISTLIGMIPTLINSAVTLFTGIVQALPKVIPKLVSALIALAPKMVSTLIGLVPQLIRAGVDLIGGLVSGLFQAAGSVGAALLDIAGSAIDGFLGFLGIKSPSRLFMGFGKNVGQGLAIGITRSVALVDKAMDGLSHAVADGFAADLTGDGMRIAVAGPVASATSRTINVNLSTLNATPDTGRMIVDAIAEYDRIGGAR